MPAALPVRALAAAAAVVVCLCAAAADAAEQRVLFIGNSFTYVQGGVWSQYKAVAEGCVAGLHVTTTNHVEPARTLAMAAGDGAAALVSSGGYDILVLQDQSDLLDYGNGKRSIHEFFAPQAKRHGATVGMYQTWAKPGWGNYTGASLWRARVYEDYARTARDVGAAVVTARAGEAFLEVLRLYSGDLDEPAFQALYDQDGEHPSLLGINLVAWVMTMAFNAAALPAGGCDPRGVPSVPGQTQAQKRRFFQIACRLAGVCAAAAPSPPPPLCKVALAMQGQWLQNKTRAGARCELGARGAAPAGCLYPQYWNVSGTVVMASPSPSVRADSAQHSLRVHDYGSFCSVKLLPAQIYAKQVSATKIVFNDCQVWTRVGSGKDAAPDECECIQPEKWTDNEGDSCAAYGPGGRKHTDAMCRVGAGGIVSQSRQLRAWQACPGCRRCTPVRHTTPLHYT